MHTSQMQTLFTTDILRLEKMWPKIDSPIFSRDEMTKIKLPYFIVMWDVENESSFMFALPSGCHWSVGWLSSPRVIRHNLVICNFCGHWIPYLSFTFAGPILFICSDNFACPVGAIDRWVDYPHHGSLGRVPQPILTIFQPSVISLVIWFHLSFACSLSSLLVWYIAHFSIKYTMCIVCTMYAK